MLKYLLLLTTFLLLVHNSFGQRTLKIEGGLDSTSICTKMINGKTATRIIIESPIRLSYKTNMEEVIPLLNKGKDKNAMVYVDTLYFTPQQFDNVRIITLIPDKYYSKKIGPIKLYPKGTYKFKVLDSQNPDLTYKIAPTDRMLFFNISAGASSFLSLKSIGANLNTELNLRLYKNLILSPSIAYNYLSIKEESQISNRNFILGAISLKYLLKERIHLSAGYAQGFLDYKDYGLTASINFILYKTLFIKGQYNYFFKFNNSSIGLSVGVVL